MDSRSDLARRLPDLPAWVEARSMLLDQRSRLLGSACFEPLSFVVIQEHADLGAVIGPAAPRAILEAAETVAELLVAADVRDSVAAVLPSWEVELATLHVRPENAALLGLSEGGARFLAEGELETIPELNDELRLELEREQAAGTRIAAAFDAARPVAFCYAGAITERWWDISIDTIEGHRRRGHAQRAVAFLIRHFASLGKQPVWGSAASNPASAALAARMGFVAVGSLWVFSRALTDDPSSPNPSQGR